MGDPTYINRLRPPGLDLQRIQPERRVVIETEVTGADGSWIRARGEHHVVCAGGFVGGYNTGIEIQNTTGTAGTMTITHYEASGTSTSTTHSIAANGYVGVCQGTDVPSPGSYTALSMIASGESI